jgi:hypothetical protein
MLQSNGKGVSKCMKEEREVVFMVRHIVAWNYGDGFTEEENKKNAQRIKEELEGLIQCIDGIIELKVCGDMLSSGNKDIILNSLFESEGALAEYQTHPEHLKAASFVRSVTQNRVCADYNE